MEWMKLLVRMSGGFTPPLSAQGKKLATYGDAVIRERVTRKLLLSGIDDISVVSSRILDRQNQSKLVRKMDLAKICSMPIAWYTGHGVWNDHTISTVLEAVVGEAVLAGCDDFATYIADQLIDLYEEAGGDGGFEDPTDASKAKEIPQDKTLQILQENTVSFVYNWASSCGLKVESSIQSGDGSYKCNVAVGTLEASATGNSKKEAKRKAFALLRESININGTDENVASSQSVQSEEVVLPSNLGSEILGDSENQGDHSDPGLPDGHFNLLEFVDKYAADFDEECELIDHDTEEEKRKAVPPPRTTKFAIESWLSQEL